MSSIPKPGIVTEPSPFDPCAADTCVSGPRLPPCRRAIPEGNTMNIDFTGKKAIVCGGSRGIGRAIALGFAAAGGDVSICAREAATLEETRAEIAKHGYKAHAASADLANEAAVRGYIRAATEALGGVDFLVNNASAFGSSDDEKGWSSRVRIDM